MDFVQYTVIIQIHKEYQIIFIDHNTRYLQRRRIIERLRGVRSVQVCIAGCQLIVIIDIPIELLDGHGVVLVDDGDDAVLHQGKERVAGVVVALRVQEAVPRQEELGHALGVLAEELLASSL